MRIISTCTWVATLLGIAACSVDGDAPSGEDVGDVSSALTSPLCSPPGAKNKSFCDGNTLVKCGSGGGKVASSTSCGSNVCTAGATYGTASCVAPKCGDGLINRYDETCDDGNTVNGDGCNSNCQVEYSVCDSPAARERSFCVGNTVVDCGFVQGTTDESYACDPSTTCTAGAYGTAYCLSPTCGNHLEDPHEGCDDGNRVDGDGCNAFCFVEPEKCGDGRINVFGETCDDGNLIDGDGCDAYCHVEATCGNSQLDIGEECDDGNKANGDGCNSHCLVESPAAPWPACGETTCAPAAAENGYAASLVSYFTGPDCTGEEYFEQPVDYDDWTNQYTAVLIHCAPFNPNPANTTPAVCGKMIHTLGYLDQTTSLMRSYRSVGVNSGACTNYAPPYGSQSSFYVKVYR